MRENRKIVEIIDTSFLEVDLVQDFGEFEIGVLIFSNSFTGDKRNNLIFSFSFFFWTLEIDFRTLFVKGKWFGNKTSHSC